MSSYQISIADMFNDAEALFTVLGDEFRLEKYSSEHKPFLTPFELRLVQLAQNLMHKAQQLQLLVKFGCEDDTTLCPSWSNCQVCDKIRTDEGMLPDERSVMLGFKGLQGIKHPKEFVGWGMKASVIPEAVSI